MKKLLAILLLLILLVTISSCAKDEKVGTDSFKEDETSIDLSLNTFGEIYDLSKDEALRNISLISRERFKKESNETFVIPFTITQNQFINVYNTLIDVQCKNSSRKEVVETKHGFDYIILFSIEKEVKYRNFHVSVGESYLLVSLTGKDTYIYKHEINKADYLIIKSMLDKIR